MKKVVWLILGVAFISCTNDDESAGSGEWLIPREAVFDGGPGKDGIPALLNPQTAPIGSSSLTYLSDNDLVLVYSDGEEITAYPHRILDWHEIANDQVGEDELAVIYCPLTGTGLGWGREINGQSTTFGVSGLLYETNIMPFDRLTESYWNQMFNQCVNGSLLGTTPMFINVVQMTFGALKSLYPSAMVTTTNTGFSRDYARYPYGNYLTSTRTLFPVQSFDQRIHPKEFVRGVAIGNESAAFRFPESGRSIQTETIGGENVIAVADKESGFIASFIVPEIDGTELTFALVEDSNSNVILIDQFENSWDIFGNAISGPNQGMQMEAPYSYMGFWFAWANFYPDIRLIE